MGDSVELDAMVGFFVDEESAVALATKGLLASCRAVVDRILAFPCAACKALGLKQIPA